MTAAHTALMAISVAGALGHFFVWLRKPPSFARSAAKTAAVAALAALSLSMDGPWLLTAALALSALGDLCLSRDGDKAFMAGLGAFLLAHLAYVALFFEMTDDFAALSVIEAAALGAYSLMMIRILWSHLGPMRLTVLTYVAAIFAMGAGALAAPPALWPLLAGAVLFILSDSVLALETFVFKDRPRRWTAPVIWPTYYAAQVFLAGAVLYPGGEFALN